MAIYAPGIRKGRRLANEKRDVIAVLQLTAMVDMFTVLVVFLLQNYATTNQILPISDQIVLPQAQQVKELRPSHVVILSKGEVIFNEDKLGLLKDGTSTDDWTYMPLKNKIEEILELAKDIDENIVVEQLKKMSLKQKEDPTLKQNMNFRVTIQADESVDFLDVKKIMYTLTEAGVKEMNFAVVQQPDLSLVN